MCYNDVGTGNVSAHDGKVTAVPCQQGRREVFPGGGGGGAIYVVAERAGVSIATVSRAMSGGSISAKSRQKVQEAIEALHYQPSTAHSHPQGQEKRTGTLALVIGDFDNPYCSMLMRGA